MAGLATLRACDQGHVIHYPEDLERTAIALMKQLAFCTTCECGTVYFVVVWAGDRTRIMASGGTDLFDKFESMLWSQEVYVDEHGLFEYSVVDNPLDVNLVLEGG
jgi:hypothetical protein